MSAHWHPVLDNVSNPLDIHQSPYLNASQPAPAIIHILSGSFRAFSLSLLAFCPLQRTLDLVQLVPAHGPHQYLATGFPRDRVYATSWGFPPALFCWAVESTPSWTLRLINTVPITATSSYISLPPPYTHIYSTGGPAGEVHRVDAANRGFGEKVQEVLFVPADELENADKTRAALRYGSHAVEISVKGHAFIPHLGKNSIHMFSVDYISGRLTLLSENSSPRTSDGPRHVVVSPDGTLLYSITEHTNYVDIFSISPTELIHRASRSLLPPGLRREANRFRGDTLRLRPLTATASWPTHLFATTRGDTRGMRGWLVVFALDSKGMFVGSDVGGSNDVSIFEDSAEVGVERWETPTSGGRANAIELRAKDDAEVEGVWIVLTDDERDEGGTAVRVLEWDSESGIRNVGAWPVDGNTVGASHAIWLD